MRSHQGERDKLGVTCGTRHVPKRPLAEAILDTAAEEGCSLIVMRPMTASSVTFDPISITRSRL